MNINDIIFLVDKLGVPIVVIIVAVLGLVLLYRGKLGKLELRTALKDSTSEEDRIRARLLSLASQDDSKPVQQYALLQEYHAQGLAQSKISFWFSLIFAAIGFAIIIVSVLAYVLDPPAADASTRLVDKTEKPIFAVVAGTIIDAVAALFFVQSNKARQLMTDFFDKLRVDRRLDESLSVLSQIEDAAIASRVKALLALNFAEVDVSDDIFRRIVVMEGSEHTQGVKPELPKPESGSSEGT